MGTTSTSYRFATRQDEGNGWSENTGADWIFPETGAQPVTIIDDNGFYHVLALDYKTGKFYDISTRDGATSSDMHKCWADKMTGASPTGGTDITGEIQFGEDRGNFEHYYLRHEEGHFYFRPYDEANKSTTKDGITYDADGYNSGWAVTAALYKDGSTTAAATASGITLDGDIVMDKVEIARRIQHIITTTKAPWRFIGRQHDYVAIDKPSSPADNVNTEMNNQTAFALPDLWADIYLSRLINRVTGATIVDSPTLVTGADGNTSGFTISAATTLGATTLAGGVGSVLVWIKLITAASVALTIGGAATALTAHSVTTAEGYTLYYATGLTASGSVILTPAGGTASICDFRSFNSAISATQRAYYYNDTYANDGKIVMPKR